MSAYQNAFKQLNERQRQAVETIDGPVLVIAGPGTGKTQLLSTRVGYILKNTDAQAQNILCLTFTEAGVNQMRERLINILGKSAHDIQINTYHAFGSSLLKRYPEFSDSYDFEPIDELGTDSIIREIQEALPYSNPLKSADTYGYDIRSLLGDLKRALITPKYLASIAKQNLASICLASAVVTPIFQNFKRVDKTSLPLFQQLLNELLNLKSSGGAEHDLMLIATSELAKAIEMAESSNKTTSLTTWKNSWLARDDSAQMVFSGQAQNNKIAALATIYEAYQEQLKSKKLFDYDDMILKTITAMEKYPDFKFNLAEQYLYIMLDEFQDTNPAQLKIVELLTDSPVNEHRPNVLAVGDDDQAIYAFQGADHTNMHRFATMFSEVKVISLTSNYRSEEPVINLADIVSSQISERLHEQFSGIEKNIISAAGTGSAVVEFQNYETDTQQYSHIATQIKKLATNFSITLSDIAILAPKHKYLTPILPFLNARKLPISYQRRENILDKPLIRQLEQIARLVCSLADVDQKTADSIWPEVLSYDFWQLKTEDIWRLSWQASNEHLGWTELVLNNELTKNIGLLLLRIKDLLPLTTLEQQIDLIIGSNQELSSELKLLWSSPLYDYYFGPDKAKDNRFIELLSELSCIRAKLRTWRRNEWPTLNLVDFVNFVSEHRQTGTNILNTSPIIEASDAINVMTAYQAKGREFKVVFVLSLSDEVWGSSSRNQGSTISLPANLAFVKFGGDGDNERLRLLYVAITRAKSHLYLTSYQKTLDGKLSKQLKYFADSSQQSPTKIMKHSSLEQSELEVYWHARHLPNFQPKLTDLLQPTIASYQLSPTHLNQFTDTVYGGPENFFLNTILRFPKASSPSAVYGTAIHDSLAWIYTNLKLTGQLPTTQKLQTFFATQINKNQLPEQTATNLISRGQLALDAYFKLYKNDFSLSDKVEQNFRNEGVFIGKAHLSGKLDRLIVDPKNKQIIVIDYKTGSGFAKWNNSSSKLYKYRQQLLFYKLLVEGSHSYRGYQVKKGILHFVEPNEQGNIDILELDFDEHEITQLKLLIEAVWKSITNLEFPNISGYANNLSGTKKFESDLISN